MTNDQAAELPEGCESVEQVFEYGQCHALALALNARTGWPIVGLYSPKQGHASHYLVRRPDGLLVDVRGARNEADVLQQWDGGSSGYYEVRGYEARQLWADVHRDDMEDPGDVWPLAKQVVAELAADVPAPAASAQPVQASADITLDSILPRLEEQSTPESKVRLLNRTAESLAYYAERKLQQAENLEAAAAAYDERDLQDLAANCRDEALRARNDADRNQAEVRALNDVASELARATA